MDGSPRKDKDSPGAPPAQDVPSSNSGIVLRVKCADKANIVLRDIQPTQSIPEFVELLAGHTSVPASNMKILAGFPPKPVALNCALTVESLGFKAQETIIIQRGSPTDEEASNEEGSCVVLGCNKKCEQKQDLAPKDAKAKSSAPAESPKPKSVPDAPTAAKTQILKPKMAPESKPTTSHRPVAPPPRSQASSSGRTFDENILNGSRRPGTRNTTRDEALNPPLISNGVLFRYIVPADNSCLFTSFRFACGPILENHTKQLTPEDSIELREIVASCVLSDPEEYSDAVLGRKSADYVKWISSLDSWGGGIELAILAGFYDIEIAVVSAQTCTCNVFGEGKHYVKRMYILYDGIHYDPLYMELADRSRIVTTFRPSDVGVYNQAIRLAEDLNRAHQYTDLANFTLQCVICKEKFKGQVDAQQHAKKTGHANFAEYSAPSSTSSFSTFM